MKQLSIYQTKLKYNQALLVSLSTIILLCTLYTPSTRTNYANTIPNRFNSPGSLSFPTPGGVQGSTIVLNFLSSDQKQATAQAAEVVAQLTQKSEQAQKQVAPAVPAGLWEQWQKTGQSLWGKLSRHKILTAVSVASLLYLYSLYRLAQLEQKLNHTTNLSQWQAHRSLDALLATDAQKLLPELDQFMKQHYEQLFKVELEQELAANQHYLQWCHWLKFWRLSKFYPVDDQKIKQAEAHVSRLNYLKGLWQSWQGYKNLYPPHTSTPLENSGKELLN